MNTRGHAHTHLFNDILSI